MNSRRVDKKLNELEWLGEVTYRIVWARMLQSSYSLVGVKEVQHKGRAVTKKREEDRDRVSEGINSRFWMRRIEEERELLTERGKGVIQLRAVSQ